MSLVLASASPRRRDLLTQLGLVFSIVNNEVDEGMTEEMTPWRLVQELALRKANAASRQLTNSAVIGADTVVVFDGQILGKPTDQTEARRMLANLQGHVHQVYTGIALQQVNDGVLVATECDFRMTEVWMRSLTQSEIEEYIATGEPMDKAGSYGIQGCGAALIDRIDGCYYNVVGLSLVLLQEMVQRLGLSLGDWRK